MSRNVLSALAVVAAGTYQINQGSIFIGWKKFFGNKDTLLDRPLIKKVLIQLRKAFYSTLRQIVFVAANLKAHEGLTTKNITEILMESGSKNLFYKIGSAERKLNAIEGAILTENKIQKSNIIGKYLGSDFEYSCMYYAETDI